MDNPNDLFPMSAPGVQSMSSAPNFTNDTFYQSPPGTTSPESITNGTHPTPPSAQEKDSNKPSPPYQSLSPTNGQAASPHLNPRSCITCRKRKVRCDKRHPCANCTKAAIECVFPGPGRAPRRSRKPPDSELLARLRRLEGVVQTLGKTAEEVGERHDTSPHEGPSPMAVGDGDENNVKKEESTVHSKFMKHLDENSATKPPDPEEKMVKEFGRLVVEEGRSRYVSNKFWSSLSEEVSPCYSYRLYHLRDGYRNEASDTVL